MDASIIVDLLPHRIDRHVGNVGCVEGIDPSSRVNSGMGFLPKVLGRDETFGVGRGNLAAWRSVTWVQPKMQEVSKISAQHR